MRGGGERLLPARSSARPAAGLAARPSTQVAAGWPRACSSTRDRRDAFRGENETLDKVGGHIPGARNYFFQQNLTDDKRFKPADRASAGVGIAMLGGTAPADVVMYCGSGVTACHNLLALEVAGLPRARIFPGSWSEWSADPSRPVEK